MVKCILKIPTITYVQDNRCCTDNSSAPSTLKTLRDKFPRNFYSEQPLDGKILSHFIENLAVALLYAAEAYHTRGAIRHIVAGIQMRVRAYYPEKLSMMDLWVSMIENWGETLKEYNHDCFDEGGKPVILEVCLLKMSKYLWRMLAAMRKLRERIRTHELEGQTAKPTKLEKLVFFPGERNPEDIMRLWLEVYKKRGFNEVRTNQQFVTRFFERFECPDVLIKNPLPANCITIMNDKVDEYNKKLAEIFSKTHPGNPKKP